MKYFFAAFFLITILIGLPIDAQAQKPNKANKLYDNFGYKTSIPLFEESINKKGMKEAELVKVANSYRLIHDTENAEKWYSEVIAISDDPIHFLHYAQALQSNGKNDEARNYFLLYDRMISGDDSRGEILANAISRMNEFKETDIQIKNETVLNSERLDFSPSFFKNGIVFVTTRPPSESKAKKDIWVDDNFTSLYYSSADEDGVLQAPAEFSEKISTKFHEGPSCFNRKEDQVFFTRSNFNHGKKGMDEDNTVRLNIYTAKKEKKDWSDAEKLDFCTDEFDEMHPSVSSDGNRLYFCSNREGGFGGMDLYVSFYKYGKWSKPVNLGPRINTPGNEVFPYIHDDGTLYFSSDGWGGLGGLDIFSTTKIDNNYWSDPLNIGTPFNSSKDDFGFILNVLGTEGYLTSARDGGQGLDDIYSFNLSPELLKKPKVIRLAAIFCTYDEKTKQRIPNVNVSIIEGTRDESGFRLDDIYTLQAVGTENEIDFYRVLLNKNRADTTAGYVDMTQITDEYGQIPFELKPDKEYIFLASKAGYLLGKRQYTTEGMNVPFDLSICIPLTRRSGISLKGIVTNFSQGNRIPEASLTLTNHCTGEKTLSKSNLLGEFSFPNLECNCEYTVTAEKEGFQTNFKKVSLLDKDCPEGESVFIEIPLRSKNESELIAAKPPSGELGVGTVIELEKIYYDFDAYYIRPGAAESLDRVVELLREYPSMNIKLSAHTDSRGTWKYNRTLSKNRARYAMKYLVSKGISAKRLKFEGWGESQLRNECDEGVDCSEEAHQYNRRTEITVTKLDRTDINIEYLNNPPEVVDPFVPSKHLYHR